MGDNIGIELVENRAVRAAVKECFPQLLAPDSEGYCAVLSCGKFKALYEAVWYQLLGEGKCRGIVLMLNGKVLGVLTVPVSAASACELAWGNTWPEAREEGDAGYWGDWLGNTCVALEKIAEEHKGQKLTASLLLPLIQFYLEAAIYDEINVNIRQECKSAFAEWKNRGDQSVLAG